MVIFVLAAMNVHVGRQQSKIIKFPGEVTFGTWTYKNVCAMINAMYEVLRHVWMLFLFFAASCIH